MPNRAGFAQRPRDWGVTLAATAGRVGFGLLFAPFVVAALPGEAAARVFQLLFLQGGLIALLSASAYARGAQLATAGGPIGPAARSYARFLALGTGVTTLAGLVLLPVPGEPGPVKLGVLSFLVAGAASSALAGFLQGVTVVQNGGLAAFLPSVMASSLGVVAVLALWRSQPTLVVVAAWGLPQILNSVLLLAAVPSTRRVFRRVGEGREPSERNFFAATGLVNATSVGTGYTFRERWTAGQPDNWAEMGFLVVRVSELLYQVLYMGAASVPGQVNRFMGRCLATAKGRAHMLVAGLGGAILAMTPAMFWGTRSVEQFLVAELAVVPARVLTMLCLLYLLGRRTTLGYQASVLGGTILGCGAMAIAPLQTSPYGLQAFHVASLAAVLLVTLLTTSTSIRPSLS